MTKEELAIRVGLWIIKKGAPAVYKKIKNIIHPTEPQAPDAPQKDGQSQPQT